MSASDAAAFAEPVNDSSWLRIGAVAIVGLALAFGGGTLQGLWSDAFLQLCSLPLLGLAVSRLCRESLSRRVKWPLALIGGMVLLLLLQLLPLPPFIWASLPGRATFVAGYRTAGMALPWLPLSLDPGATWFSLLSVVPAITVFLAVLLTDLKTRRILSGVILGFAFLSVMLGLAQLAGGENSPLRFYDPTNLLDSVGFFANRNHYAALLTAAIPLSMAWFVGLALGRDAKRGLGPLLLLSAYAVLLLGIGVSHSRAGLILAIVGALASIVLIVGASGVRADPSRRRKLLLFLVGANLLGLGLAFQFGFVGFANRLEDESVLEDLRRPIAEVSARAIEANLPFGVGFGAFEPVYQMFEPESLTIEPYINHAHDDWLEVTLDGGLPAVALLLAFLFWFVAASIETWREAPLMGGAFDGALARAAPIVIGLLLLHSTLDYPLRTTTLMVVFACAAALMIPPLEAKQLASRATGKPRTAGKRKAVSQGFRRPQPARGMRASLVSAGSPCPPELPAGDGFTFTSGLIPGDSLSHRDRPDRCYSLSERGQLALTGVLA